jgi:UDP-N-acetylmuramate--alanine ligase
MRSCEGAVAFVWCAMHYFFSGIGGAGTLPLAQILTGQGHQISWSDRDFDGGKLPGKFATITRLWPQHYPQDGSGVTQLAPTLAALIPSGTVEDKVPDIAAAKAAGVRILKRPELLSQLFSKAKYRIGVVGTSGKTTTTGLLGYLLQELGRAPTIMNGGILANYATPENPLCCGIAGKGDTFVSEVDESDGSIALFWPKVALLTNIGFDHKPIEELTPLFSAFLAKAQGAALNFDDARVRSITSVCKGIVVSYGLDWPAARFTAREIKADAGGSSFMLHDRTTEQNWPTRLNLPGAHNISNALGCFAVLALLGQDLGRAAELLAGFKGIKRRLELVGQARGITVIDDFAHNPDKVAASLSALTPYAGRLLVMFQPHGYGPLRLMYKELAQSFAGQLRKDDLLFVPEPFYAGGTVDRSVTSAHFVDELKKLGVAANVFPDRASISAPLLSSVKNGDRIIIMGARDDTLADYAAELLNRLQIAA